MSVLLFVNLKGGVAKTTNAVAVAECLADAGLRTLLIDADHQCMSGELLLGERRMERCEARKITLHDLMAAMLEDEFSVSQLPSFVVKGVSNIGDGLPNLSVMPCSMRIDDFSTNRAKAGRGYRSNDEFLAMYRKRRLMLRKWLNSNYDYTIVDCPPSIALQVKMFLSIADAFIIPAIPDRLSVRGSIYLLERIRRMGYKVEGLGTLWSLYREQNALHRRVVEAASAGREPLSRLPRPFETMIPNASAISEATETGQAPKSFAAKYTPRFARLYQDLCQEIVKRSQWKAPAVGAPAEAATS